MISLRVVVFVFFSFVFAYAQQGLNSITLLKPTQSNPAIVLANSDKETVILEVTVIDPNGQPVKGLTSTDFNVEIGGDNANILSVIDTDIQYYLSIKVPQKSEGKYDLRIKATNSKETVEKNAIEYTKSGKENIDVVLVIDRSGSMDGQPIEDAKNAAKTFVDNMNIDDQIGIVSFSDSVSIDFPLTLIINQSIKDDVKNAIDNIYASGSTSIGGGLEKAAEELINKGRNGIPNYIVLLSDGYENSSPYVADILPNVIQSNITVYTVGLGSYVDDNLMNNIAAQTGGQYLKAPSSQDLLNLYSTIAGKIVQRETIVKETKNISPGTTEKITVPVDPSLTRVLFFFEWSDPNAQFDVKLQDPNGNVIDENNCSNTCSYNKGTTFIYYDVDNPLPGEWNIIVTSNSGGVGEGGAKSEKPSLKLEVVFSKPLYAPGESITAFAHILDADNQKIITGATITGEITLPSGQKEGVLFYDDGTNGDNVANDGIYTLVYNNTSLEGLYTLDVNAKGTYNNYHFSRSEIISTYVQSQAKIFIPLKVVNFGAVDPKANNGIKKQVIIYNVGGSSLEVRDFNISGNNSNDFTIVNNNCVDSQGNPIAVAPNKSCVIEIEFKPTDYGNKTANLEMITNDPVNQAYNIKLTGQGISLTPIYIEKVDFNPGCAPKPFTVDFSVIATGGSGNYNYIWDFDGDGKMDEYSSQSKISHTYDVSGTYNVLLKVEDSQNSNNYREANMTICVLDYPQIGIDKFSANPVIGVAPLDVIFDVSVKGGSGSYIYEWDFDNDGNIDSNEQHPTFTYFAPGKYTAKIFVKDANDPNNKIEGSVEISVLEEPNPISVSLDANHTSGELPLDVDFILDIKGGTPPYTITWDFGDGTKETETVSDSKITKTHRYTSAGTYNVVVQIQSIDGYGNVTKEVQAKINMTITATKNNNDNKTISAGCNFGSTPSNLTYLLLILMFITIKSIRRLYK